LRFERKVGHRLLAVLAALAVVAALAAVAALGCGKKDRPPESETDNAIVAENSASEAAITPEALSQVLQANLPKVLDFGRGVCIPCKKMAPILNELAAVYRDRALIRIIDIGEPGGRELSREFGIQLIPTQIFIDAEGNEVWRHEGFLSQEEIVQKLAEMGVEPD